ncbi:MAG: hypothetical protein IJF80_01925 [Clostridia bacterium]|nr:hypothetical protein [Clostridia bacterium]
MKKFLKTVLPNLCIVLAVMLIVLFCIDYVNPAMQFIDNDIARMIMFVVCILALTVAIMYIKYFYNDDKE